MVLNKTQTQILQYLKSVKEPKTTHQINNQTETKYQSTLSNLKILNKNNYINLIRDRGFYLWKVDQRRVETRYKRLALYHATTLDRVPSVMSKGLIAGYKDPSGQSWISTYHGKGSYFHTRFPKHEIYNSYYEDDVHSAVLEFRFVGDLNKVIAEEEGYVGLKGEEALQEGGGIVYLQKRISQTSVKKIHIADIGNKGKIFEDVPRLRKYKNKIVWFKIRKKR